MNGCSPESELTEIADYEDPPREVCAVAIRLHGRRMLFPIGSLACREGPIGALTFVNYRDTLTMGRPRHPTRVIEEAVRYAENRGWRFIEAGSSSHAWGRLYCRERSRDGCMLSIWSTPRVPENHAAHLRREVKKCPHGAGQKQ